MKVVFLDIDGVVNTLKLYKTAPNHIPPEQLKLVEGYYVDICSSSNKRVSNIDAMCWLDKLCHKFDLKMVISSTWRLGDMEEVKEALYNSGLSRDVEIIGKTERLYTDHCRGDEIKLYLNQHKDIENFVIFDDDSDIYRLDDHFIQTNTYVGITFNEYERACRILEKN